MSEATVTNYPELRLFIDGEWVEGNGKTGIRVDNPATGEALGSFQSASPDDVDHAIHAAGRTFLKWRQTPPNRRAAILHEAARLVRSRSSDLSLLMALELGKPVIDGPAEVERAAELLEWHANQGLRVYGDVIPAPAGVQQTVLNVPIGPVAALTPWNGPAASPARKISAALAAGCTIVIKPAEETPATALALAACFRDAGLPPGVLNIVLGNPVEISEQLIESPTIRMVTFTGSVAVGRRLAELGGRHLKPLVLELGGHAPVIVCADSDPRIAAHRSAIAKFRNAGQICISPTRFFVHAEILDEFTGALADAARELPVGNPLDNATRMGPLIHDRRLEAVDELVRDAISRGATLCAGGRRLEGRGAFYAPTILADVPNDSRILREEPFGPVAVIQRFEDIDEVCDRANATDLGLAAYAFTRSAETAARITERLETGMLSINHFSGASPNIPFGGVKNSGYGREGGARCFDSYLTCKSVSHLTSAH